MIVVNQECTMAAMFGHSGVCTDLFNAVGAFRAACQGFFAGFRLGALGRSLVILDKGVKRKEKEERILKKKRKKNE